MNEHVTTPKSLRPRYERAERYPDKWLTPRDARILRWVHQMRFLSREQIQKLEFGPNGERYCRDRLRWLFDAGYLDRRRLDLRTGFGANMPVYCLEQRGAECIALDQKMDPCELGWKPRDNRVDLHFMEHTLAVNDFWIDVVLATRNGEGELELWLDERTLKSKTMRDFVYDSKLGKRIAIIPDGYFCIRLPDERRACFALELDRGTLERKRWKTRVRAYRKYMRSGQYRKRYGTSSLRVLTVVQAARRAISEEDRVRLIRQRVEAIRKWAMDERGGGFFWFAAQPDITPDTLLSAQIWRIAGSDGDHVLID